VPHRLSHPGSGPVAKEKQAGRSGWPRARATSSRQHVARQLHPEYERLPETWLAAHPAILVRTQVSTPGPLLVFPP
jgi:hypothetical protein